MDATKTFETQLNSLNAAANVFLSCLRDSNDGVRSSRTLAGDNEPAELQRARRDCLNIVRRLQNLLADPASFIENVATQVYQPP